MEAHHFIPMLDSLISMLQTTNMFETTGPELCLLLYSIFHDVFQKKHQIYLVTYNTYTVYIYTRFTSPTIETYPKLLVPPGSRHGHAPGSPASKAVAISSGSASMTSIDALARSGCSSS